MKVRARGSMRDAHKRGLLARALAATPVLSAPLRSIIRRAVDRDPAKRYRDARAMLADLARLAVPLGITDDTSALADAVAGACRGALPKGRGAAGGGAGRTDRSLPRAWHDREPS